MLVWKKKILEWQTKLSYSKSAKVSMNMDMCLYVFLPVWMHGKFFLGISKSLKQF